MDPGRAAERYGAARIGARSGDRLETNQRRYGPAREASDRGGWLGRREAARTRARSGDAERRQRGLAGVAGAAGEGEGGGEGQGITSLASVFIQMAANARC